MMDVHCVAVLLLLLIYSVEGKVTKPPAVTFPGFQREKSPVMDHRSASDNALLVVLPLYGVLFIVAAIAANILLYRRRIWRQHASKEPILEEVVVTKPVVPAATVELPQKPPVITIKKTEEIVKTLEETPTTKKKTGLRGLKSWLKRKDKKKKKKKKKRKKIMRWAQCLCSCAGYRKQLRRECHECCPAYLWKPGVMNRLLEL